MEELLVQLTNPVRYQLMWLSQVKSQVALYCLLFLEAGGIRVLPAPMVGGSQWKADHGPLVCALGACA